MLARHLARPTLGNAQLITDMIDTGPAASEAQKFRCAVLRFPWQPPSGSALVQRQIRHGTPEPLILLLEPLQFL